MFVTAAFSVLSLLSGAAAFRLHPGCDQRWCVEHVWPPWDNVDNRQAAPSIQLNPCYAKDIGITSQDWQWDPIFNLIQNHDNEETGEICMSFGDMGISIEYGLAPSYEPKYYKPANGANGTMYWCASSRYYANDGNGWDYVDNLYLRIKTTNFCLDLPDGVKRAGQPLQIWECADGNRNQVWSLSESGPYKSNESE